MLSFQGFEGCAKKDLDDISDWLVHHVSRYFALRTAADAVDENNSQAKGIAMGLAMVLYSHLCQCSLQSNRLADGELAIAARQRHPHLELSFHRHRSLQG